MPAFPKWLLSPNPDEYLNGSFSADLSWMIINETALGAYLWLDESCRPARDCVGTDALAVCPRQRAGFVDHKRFSESMRELIAWHHDSTRA